MQKYQILGKKGEGAFSEVLKAQDICTKQYVAIKCMKKEFVSKEQVNKLREIQAVRRLQPHRHIVQLIEVLFNSSTRRLALVLELMDMNLYELIKGRRQLFSEEKLVSYMYQLLKGLDHAHRAGLFHRDLKPENLLVNSNGLLKIADFGSCKGIYSKQPLTEYISTRWYRAPECLLTDGYYSYKMDLWSAGCVFFELAALYPLFPGSNELDQVDKIHDILGTPSQEVLEKLATRNVNLTAQFPHKDGIGLAKLVPHLSAEALDLMSMLLQYDEDKRYSTREALRHPFFNAAREANHISRRKKREALSTSLEKRCESLLDGSMESGSRIDCSGSKTLDLTMSFEGSDRLPRLSEHPCAVVHPAQKLGDSLVNSGGQDRSSPLSLFSHTDVNLPRL